MRRVFGHYGLFASVLLNCGGGGGGFLLHHARRAGYDRGSAVDGINDSGQIVGGQKLARRGVRFRIRRQLYTTVQVPARAFAEPLGSTAPGRSWGSTIPPGTASC